MRVTGISLKELRSLSKKLNEASDELSTQFNAFEAALNELKLGVWAWVEIKAYHVDAEWSPGGRGPTLEIHELGYGKHKGKWCLLHSVSNPEFGDPEFDRVTPLRDAPRDERIDAADKLPGLVRELENKVKALTKQAADKAVEVSELVSAMKGTTT
jgi:hypothetical protein